MREIKFKICDYLREATIEGNIIKLPSGQLAREEYMQVKKKLEGIGGKWKGGKTYGFIFDVNPEKLLKEIIEGNNINLKKDFQYFATPKKIADKLVYYADIQNHDTILEPSAGQGAIIKAINKYSDIRPDCYELMEQNRIILKENPEVYFKLIGNDFLRSESKEYSKIIANPPFTKNQDIEHIYKMFERLGNGGRLVSIASNHWKQSQNKKETNFRNWLDKHNAEIVEIESGEFKESGTNISCCIIIINKEVVAGSN